MVKTLKNKNKNKNKNINKNINKKTKKNFPNKIRNKTKKKRNFQFKNINKNININKIKKRYLSETQITTICKNEDQYYKFADNLFSLKKIGEKTEMAITDFVKNKADLIRVFKQHQNLEKEQKHAETDFYTYVNAVWLKNTHIQNKLNYYVKYDEVRTVQDKVYYQLIYYVQTFIKEQPHTKKGRALKNLYHSLTANTTPSLKKNCHQIQHTLEQYFVQGQMVDLLAYINRSLILSWSSPIAWKVLPDEKNVKQYISHLLPPVLGLSDYTLYLTDPQDTAKVKAHKQYIKEHYLKYIKAVFTACLGANTPVNPRDIWTVETDLLVALGCEAADDDQPKNLKKHTEAAADNKFSFYNVLSSAELIKDYFKKLISN